MNNKIKFDIYQTITDQIIEILETHKSNNFQNNWFPSSGEVYAQNPVSKSYYRGFNQLYLSFVASEKGYTQNRWLTFKQCTMAGGKIKKGEKSRIVTFWLMTYRNQQDINVTSYVEQIIKNGGEVPEDIKKMPTARYYTVFNLDQCENLPSHLYFKGDTLKLEEFQKDDIAEEFLLKTGAKVKYVKDNLPCYRPGTDIIVMPDRKQYREKEGFYSDVMHELTHWTGNKNRLNREMNFNRTSKEYAFEELIAEIGSAFICGLLGFTTQITNNAAYIENWLTNLKNDKMFVYKASRQAQFACDYCNELVKTSVALKTRN